MNNIDILKRLYNDYTKKYVRKIIFSVFLSLIVAGSTASIAWLLDPAIKKIFIEVKASSYSNGPFFSFTSDKYNIVLNWLALIIMD